MHEWYPSSCAPVTAPVRILSGQFITRDKDRVRIPAGLVLNNGWGAIGATIITANPLKALPESLHIRWFSFTESKFYKGNFQLDAARLDCLFEAGYERPVDNQTKRFDRIVVGMSPGGGVAVWLKGEQITRELAFFQATEAQEDWNTFSEGGLPSRAEYVQAQLGQLLEPLELAVALEAAREAPARWSESYRIAYPWTLRFLSRGRIRQLVLRYWNGDVLLADTLPTPPDHPLPEQLDVYWENPDGVNYGAAIRFDFDELSAAFKRLVPDGPLRLGIEADTLSLELGIFLANATEVYRFRKASIRVFQQ